MDVGLTSIDDPGIDRNSPELYRRLVQSVVDYAIYALDRRGRVVNWTVGAERIKGYTVESQEHMRLLQGRVRRMEALIDGILAYSRAGRLRSAPEPVDSGAVAAEVIELLAPPPGVRIELPPAMPTVQAERAPFQQVFMNLLANALKFTPERGTIVLGAEAAGSEVRLSVADTGVGISPAHLPHVFDRYWQARSADRASAGLGLAIAKSIVEAHGGQIRVESTEGLGTLFSFTVPVAKAG